MNGITIGAKSNANTMISKVNEKSHTGSQYFTKHHWIVSDKESVVGPLEM